MLKSTDAEDKDQQQHPMLEEKLSPLLAAENISEPKRFLSVEVLQQPPQLQPKQMQTEPDDSPGRSSTLFELEPAGQAPGRQELLGNTTKGGAGEDRNTNRRERMARGMSNEHLEDTLTRLMDGLSEISQSGNEGGDSRPARAENLMAVDYCDTPSLRSPTTSTENYTGGGPKERLPATKSS